MSFPKASDHETGAAPVAAALSIAKWLLWLGALTAALLVLPGGCNTVTPVETEARQASFDGGAQDSGFLGWQTNAAGAVSGILTSHARERYNALGAAYGKRFTPALVSDAGLTAIDPGAKGRADGASAPGTIFDPRAAWLIDAQHLVYFATMNRWKKEAVKP